MVMPMVTVEVTIGHGAISNPYDQTGGSQLLA